MRRLSPVIAVLAFMLGGAVLVTPVTAASTRRCEYRGQHPGRLTARHVTCTEARYVLTEAFRASARTGRLNVRVAPSLGPWSCRFRSHTDATATVRCRVTSRTGPGGRQSRRSFTGRLYVD